MILGNQLYELVEDNLASGRLRRIRRLSPLLPYAHEHVEHRRKQRQKCFPLIYCIRVHYPGKDLQTAAHHLQFLLGQPHTRVLHHGHALVEDLVRIQLHALEEVLGHRHAHILHLLLRNIEDLVHPYYVTGNIHEDHALIYAVFRQIDIKTYAALDAI